MKGVFIRRFAGGYDEIITSEPGTLLPTADGARLQLELGVGRMVREQTGGELDDTRFQHAVIFENFSSQAPPFRPRGNSERELTLGELWSGMHETHPARSEEHTSELQSLMRISYAVFCLKKNTP